MVIEKPPKFLFIIPARGGSKSIPRKNIKLFSGKPLIYYSIDIAKRFVNDDDICVSSDDDEIIHLVEGYGLKVPFKRPYQLATDTATSNDVLLHAIRYYEKKGVKYDGIILLQPTSPLRKMDHIKEAISLYSSEIDMVVSVRVSHSASVICQEDKNGFLELILNKTVRRRQDLAEFYEFNGSIYVINVESIREKGVSNFTKQIKYVMPNEYSIDIDTEMDWQIAECLFSNFQVGKI